MDWQPCITPSCQQQPGLPRRLSLALPGVSGSVLGRILGRCSIPELPDITETSGGLRDYLGPADGQQLLQQLLTAFQGRRTDLA